MSYKSPYSFKKYPGHINMNRLLKIADKLDLSSCDYNNYMHIVCNIIKRDTNTENLVMMQTHIEFEEIFKIWEGGNQKKLSKYFESIQCGWYDDNLKFKEYCFIIQLNNFMLQKKIIFVMLDFHEYIIHDCEKNKDHHELCAHSTAAIFYPNKEGTYNMFHFNPHGQAIMENEEYEIYLTRHRLRNIDLSVPLDWFVMSKFIEIYNKEIGLYRDDYVTINYKQNKQYNYVGPNLQVVDTYGICYAYPFLLFYELCHNFETSIFLEDNTFNNKRRFPSYKKLILREDFHKIIFIMLSKIYEDIKYNYLSYLIKSDKDTSVVNTYEVTQAQQNINDDIEYILEKRGMTYTKLMFMQVINYISQPLLRKEVEKYINF